MVQRLTSKDSRCSAVLHRDALAYSEYVNTMQRRHTSYRERGGERGREGEREIHGPDICIYCRGEGSDHLWPMVPLDPLTPPHQIGPGFHAAPGLAWLVLALLVTKD